MVTDPVSDFIIRLQNASFAGKESTVVSYSKFTESIAHLLKKAGYLSSVEKKGAAPFRELEIGIAQIEGASRIHGVERISKSSRRMYQKYTDIRVYKSGFGNTVLSTSKGVLTDMEAKRLKVGGEVLFRIW